MIRETVLLLELIDAKRLFYFDHICKYPLIRLIVLHIGYFLFELEP